MHSRKSSAGFTLIELMIVVAVIAIFTAIALPSYQNYVARAQASEGLSLSTGAKLAIATHYAEWGLFPTDNSAAGLAPPASITGRYVQSVTVDPTGNILVAFSSSASAKISGQTLTLAASDNDGSIRWECNGLDTRYLPSPCGR